MPKHKVKTEEILVKEAPAAALDGTGSKSKFFRMKDKFKETALGQYAKRKRDAFRNTKLYEEYTDVRDSLRHEDSPFLMIGRLTPFVNAYLTWRYNSQISKMKNALEKSADFLKESLHHFKTKDAKERMAFMKNALREAKKSATAIKASMVLAVSQTLWLGYDMVSAFLGAPPEMSFFQKVIDAFKDNATGPKEAISAVVSIAITMGIHYAFHRKEKARKRELMAQVPQYLTDSELRDLLGILNRQIIRAKSRKDYDEKKAEPLLKKYREVQDESVARRMLQGPYIILDEAKKTRMDGNEAKFRIRINEFIGELMRHNKFDRVEIVSHASGENGEIVKQIANEQVLSALNDGEAEDALRINQRYGCLTQSEFDELKAARQN